MIDADEYDIWSSDNPYNDFSYESTVFEESCSIPIPSVRKFYRIIAKTQPVVKK